MVILKWVGKFYPDGNPVSSYTGAPCTDLEKEDIDRYARNARLSFTEAKAELLATKLWAATSANSGKKHEGEPETTGD